jgi:hypothetical protein
MPPENASDFREKIQLLFADLWPSDPRTDFCWLLLPPIYIAAATTNENPPPKSSKIPETMNNNKDYRYQLESKKLMGDI